MKKQILNIVSIIFAVALSGAYAYPMACGDALKNLGQSNSREALPPEQIIEILVDGKFLIARDSISGKELFKFVESTTEAEDEINQKNYMASMSAVSVESPERLLVSTLQRFYFQG